MAEVLVEQEQLTAQFTGDLAAFDRLEALADAFARAQPEPGRAALVTAQVACSTHRFAHARVALEQAQALGRCGRRHRAAHARSSTRPPARTCPRFWPRGASAPRGPAPGPNCCRWVRCSPIWANLTKPKAPTCARCASTRTCRPLRWPGPAFSLACCGASAFRGPQPQRAAQWYRSAIDYLPCYVKARVHLAEIDLDQGRVHDARTLLTPVLESGDPEVAWRLADVAQAAGRNGRSRASSSRPPALDSSGCWRSTRLPLPTTAPSSMRAVAATPHGPSTWPD